MYDGLYNMPLSAIRGLSEPGHVGNQAMPISSLFSGLIWIATLSVIPMCCWGQQAPFYDTVQFEHAPSVNNKLGYEFCRNMSRTNHVLRDNARGALVGGPLTNKILFHDCCRIVYPLPSVVRKYFFREEARNFRNGRSSPLFINV